MNTITNNKSNDRVVSPYQYNFHRCRRHHHHCCWDIQRFVLHLIITMAIITMMKFTTTTTTRAWVYHRRYRHYYNSNNNNNNNNNNNHSFKNRNNHNQQHISSSLFFVSSPIFDRTIPSSISRKSTTTATSSGSSRSDIIRRYSWHGPTSPFSEYAMHVQVGQDDLPVTVQDAIARSMGEDKVVIQEKEQEKNDQVSIPPTVQKLTPKQLLLLGSVWFSRPETTTPPHGKNQNTNNQNHNYTTTDLSSLPPPQRLTLQDANKVLQAGDYLRIHHTPRRFTNVYKALWKDPTSADDAQDEFYNHNGDDEASLPRVILPIRNNANNNNHDSGFWIINKPPLIPVHASVDNAYENVVHQLQVANRHLILQQQQRQQEELQQQQQQQRHRQQQRQQQQQETSDNDSSSLDMLPYIATTQRIDINTSGLLVVATQKDFAAYFATLLRNKTKEKLLQHQFDDMTTRNQHLHDDDTTTTTSTDTTTDTTTIIYITNSTDATENLQPPLSLSSTPSKITTENATGTIEKGYKCLVCLQQSSLPPPPQQQQQSSSLLTSSTSIYEEYQRLINLQNKTIRHYLECSERAPKRFELRPPSKKDGYNNDDNIDDPWLECILTITKVSPMIYPTITTTVADIDTNDNQDLSSFSSPPPPPSSSSSSSLVQSLWTGASLPSSVKAVCEVEIQLGTGRTHQIRGQMAKLGFPLVGDELYGGAIPIAKQFSSSSSSKSKTKTETTSSSGGGAGSSSNTESTVATTSSSSSSSSLSSSWTNDQSTQLLALQCCHVGFWDPDYIMIWNKRKRRNIVQGIPSNRWISATLERAWWTPFLEEYETNNLVNDNQDGDANNDELSTAATTASLYSSSPVTSMQDFQLRSEQQQQQQTATVATAEENETKEGKKKGEESGRYRPDLLPPTVQLSPGRNKYVLVRVQTKQTDSNNNEGGIETTYWFVKSASPKECGGPYHANVAQDLIEWIQAAGYDDIVVTGGGRIDYDTDKNRAHVYGFSYGYGKGNHAKAAQLISEQRILATYDNSDNLY